VGNSHIYYIPS